MDFNNFLSVKNMLEDGLERDHITVNTTIYCVIEQQLDNHRFIHEPMTTINRVSRDKSVPCTCPVVMVTVRAPRTQQPFPCIFFQILLGCVQLPTLLRQQFWKLLRSCWQWCANGCNNSQQCWDLQCIVGRIQPISLCKPCVMSVRDPNNVGRAMQTDPTLLRYASAITKQKKC